MSASLLVVLSLGVLSFAAVAPHSVPHSVNGTLPKPPQVKGSGVLKLPITSHNDTIHGKLRRQSSDPLLNVHNAYYISIGLGSPPQTVNVQIDTGSSELWVDPVCADSSDPSYCTAQGRYDPDTSSSAVDDGYQFSITYGTGDVSGEYLSDNMVMGGASIQAQQFGWATESSFAVVGIMGVCFGYPLLLDYYNVIDELYVQGITASRAFSVDLASIDVADGAIIFGGIDTKKYIGALEKRPIIPYSQSPDGFPRYWIYMTSVGITMPGSTTSNILTTKTYNQGMFPDSGATLSQLPPNLHAALLSFFPSAVSQGNGLYSVDCGLRNQAGTIDFGFGNTIIHVAFYDWIWTAGSLCYFGGVSNPDTFSLGDTFMRSAYLVYDQDNMNVFVAQAANCGTNVVAIGSGTNAVPSITGACKAATSTTSAKPSSSTKSSSSTKTTSTSKVTAVTTTSSKSSSKTSTSTAKTTSTSKVTTTSSSKSTSTSKTTTSKTSTSSSKTSTSSSKTSTSSSKTSTSSSKTSTSSSKTSSTSTKPISTVIKSPVTTTSGVSSCRVTSLVPTTVTVTVTASATHGTCTAVGQKF